MKKRILSLVALAALTLTLAVSAQAALLSLNVSGQFSPTTTLGGTPFGVNTPFTYSALFDSTIHTQYYYPVSYLTVSIGGSTYTMASGTTMTANIFTVPFTGVGIRLNNAQYMVQFINLPPT